MFFPSRGSLEKKIGLVQLFILSLLKKDNLRQSWHRVIKIPSQNESNLERKHSVIFKYFTIFCALIRVKNCMP